MSNDNITFIGFGRIRDQVVLASQFDRLTTQEKNSIENSFKKFLLEGLSRFGAGTREKKSFPEGTFFLLADAELCCLYGLAVRSKNYPERIAFSCLAETIRMVADSEEGHSLNTADRPNSLTRVFRKGMKDLMDKYDNPSNVDKVSEVGGKIDHVKGIMRENINKVIATHANIQELEEKTDNLNQNAEKFQQNAGDLSRVMWWQKTKVTIMLVVVAAAVVAYVITGVVKYVT